LLERIIRVSSNEGDLVFDPFTGSGTTLAVAKRLGRDWLGCELSEQYKRIALERIKQTGGQRDRPASDAAPPAPEADGAAGDAGPEMSPSEAPGLFK
jgi:site-specific DNA-methyltransferase (adenine-specific)